MMPELDTDGNRPNSGDVTGSSSSSEDEFAYVDDGVHWSYGVNSLNSFNLIPKDGDYNTFKAIIHVGRVTVRCISCFEFSGSCTFFRDPRRPLVNADCQRTPGSTPSCGDEL
ncbi:hypothetical protein EG68_11562 [Paragonimus skrjabini miyazakii]|uniref:Uncharacterized protein n=1 Tax=Paragonimus skrjabini miyazakii TaxID=59628 RepID=A0A8S9YMR6_9TREM|nr:hypothetical protein EG68_11562 [Paragonimus skrjabini miyazakii]